MRITKYTLQMENQKHILVKEKSINYKTAMDDLASPDKVAIMMNDCFCVEKLSEEYVFVVAVDNKMKSTGIFEISHGSINQSIVDVKSVFSRLLLVSANGFFLLHNHPSGDTKPSMEDLQITKRIKDASELMSITLLDHIIIGDGYYSFFENSLL